MVAADPQAPPAELALSLQVVKHRSGRRLIGMNIKVIYGTPEEVRALPGEPPAYVERSI